jgi:SOS response regulatory protein OraA/RecX
LPAADPDDDALDAAARLLGRRDHARAELRVKLARRGDDDAAERAVERLAELGLVDDRRYAAGLAAARLSRGYGPARIVHDLERAGVAPEVIRSTLDALAPADVRAAAERVTRGRDDGTALRRLAARGFGEEDIPLPSGDWD